MTNLNYHSRWVFLSALIMIPPLVNSDPKPDPSATNKTKELVAESKPKPVGASAYDSWIKSAQKGDANAQFNLALILEQGVGVKKDIKKAVYWYRKSATKGHAVAQYNLATLLHFGKGVNKDETAAAKWYELAAKSGHIVAQSSLAYLYLQHSNKSFRDSKKAAYWYNRAAKLGYPEAQFNLGLLYASGRGVLLNYKQAYAWFDLAQLNNYKNALKSRNSAASRLDVTQLKEAQQLSQTMQQLYFRKQP